MNLCVLGLGNSWHGGGIVIPLLPLSTLPTIGMALSLNGKVEATQGGCNLCEEELIKAFVGYHDTWAVFLLGVQNHG